MKNALHLNLGVAKISRENYKSLEQSLVNHERERGGGGGGGESE